MTDTDTPQIMIMGIGNVLFKDEGFGIHVIKKIEDMVTFSENVRVVDGGVLGVHLLGVMSEADHLIVIDIIRNHGAPGSLYRIDRDGIPDRIRAKNSVHQIDFLEALTLMQALDKVPETVILGVEPKDMETLDVDMTPEIAAQVDPIIDAVLKEVARLGATYTKGTHDYVPSHPFQNC
ncbi:MAG: HyaD/HybD family hydrogenase maturation endopeptidase [Pseudomonadota bacterium]